MVLKNSTDFFYGYIQIEIEGFYIERFFNTCAKENIRLWKTKRINRSKVYTNISIHDLKKIRKITRKTKCHIKIKRKKGIPFIIKKYKKRKVFLAFFLIIVFLIFALSNFVWNIEIEGNVQISSDELLEELQNEGLYQGILKNKVNTNKIIEKMRLENEKIAWIGIKIEGTNAKVTIVEATDKPDLIDKDEYCNIVSDKEGIITSINVTNGTALAGEGDVIEPGTKLIGGWMEGKYTGVRYMHASGDIKAKVWYTAEDYENFIQEENIKTENLENKYSLLFNKNEINFYKRLSKFEKYDTIETSKKIKLFNNFYLPIEFKKRTNYEYKIVKKQYEKEELKDKIVLKLEEQMQEKLENKELINKDIVVEENETGMRVRLVYEVIENVGVEEKLVS